MSNWIYIDDISSLDKTDFIFCDTRDFCINCVDNKTYLKELNKYFKNKISICKITHDEILPLLKDLEIRSGGKGSWRSISTTSYKKWLKYIRFMKISDNEYFVYTNTGDDNTPLPVSTLKESINLEYLNFIE